MEINPLVSVSIKSPYNCNDFLVISIVTLLFKEELNVSVVQETFVGDIKSVENLVWAPIKPCEKLTFHVFEPKVKLDLFLKEIGKNSFQLFIESPLMIKSSGFSLRGIRSEMQIIAWKHHLHEFSVVETTVLINIKIFYKVLAISN